MRNLFLILTLCGCSIFSYAQLSYVKTLFWDANIAYRYPIKYYDSGHKPVFVTNNDINVCLDMNWSKIEIIKTPQNDNNVIKLNLLLFLKNDKIKIKSFYFNKIKINTQLITKILNKKYDYEESIKDSLCFYYISIEPLIKKNKSIDLKDELLVVKYISNNKVLYTKIPLDLFYVQPLYIKEHPHNTPPILQKQ